MTCQDSHHKYSSSLKLVVILNTVMLVCTMDLLICVSHYSYAPFFDCIQALCIAHGLGKQKVNPNKE
jgi:hypothetical protein